MRTISKDSVQWVLLFVGAFYIYCILQFLLVMESHGKDSLRSGTNRIKQFLVNSKINEQTLARPLYIDRQDNVNNSGVIDIEKETPQNLTIWKEDTENSANDTSGYYIKLAEKLDVLNSSQLLGEMGIAEIIKIDKLSEEDKLLFDQGWQDNAYNLYLSDRISLHRKLPDPIQMHCPNETYHPIEELPSASVIIIFHNEGWSVLLRTIHSVIDRTPPQVLKEIILVDDASTMEHLHKPLEIYAGRFDKIKLVRSPERAGLIRARLLGVNQAVGEVLIFLDSHCEATAGWAVPLLDRIASDKTHVVTPVIEIIHPETFEFFRMVSPKDVQVGGFKWNLGFNWVLVSERDRKLQGGINNPVRSPTMAGGLFAINREFFHHLGTYDSDMEIWGAENVELSFRIWMCGGTLEVVPCSRVGHIFRSRSPYSWGEFGKQAVIKNMVRVAEVWLDEYKDLFYAQSGFKNVEFGDISERLEIRKSLKCHNFKWYLDNVYPQLWAPLNVSADGEIRSGNTYRCLDGPAAFRPIEVQQCHGHRGNQQWYLSTTGEIRRENNCITNDNGVLQFYPCHFKKGNQYWDYTEKNRLVNKEVCLEIDEHGQKLDMKPCNNLNERQTWVWKRKKMG